jgi:hypothetical protein
LVIVSAISNLLRWWHLSDIEAARSNVRFRPLSDVSAKVLNSSEDAHLKT